MRLIKRIPSGAGLGGGSADAAAALLGLNELWKLQLSRQALLEAGLSLGADIPFLLTGGLARVGGIGEAITPLAPAPRLWLLLMQPCGGLSTREVFSAFDSLPPGALAHPDTEAAQAALLSNNPSALASAMQNVLEGVSLQARPAMPEAIAALESSGALRAMMTGSGSVVYGLYKDEAHARAAHASLQRQAERLGLGTRMAGAHASLTHAKKAFAFIGQTVYNAKVAHRPLGAFCIAFKRSKSGRKKVRFPWPIPPLPLP